MGLRTVNWNEDNNQGRVFAAKYPGTCEGCGEDFEAGADVFYLNGDLYADHNCAVEDEPRPETCPRCFQTFSNSGACGC